MVNTTYGKQEKVGFVLFNVQKSELSMSVELKHHIYVQTIFRYYGQIEALQC